MAYEPRPGDGALFGNKDRTKDTQPNATGYVIAHRDIKAGEKLRLAAWTKEGRQGKFQSLKLSDDQRREQPTNTWRDNAAGQDWQAPDDPLDDSAPF